MSIVSHTLSETSQSPKNSECPFIIGESVGSAFYET